MQTFARIANYEAAQLQGKKMVALPTAEAELRLRAGKNSEIGEGLHFSVITAPRKSNVTTSVPAVTVCA
jgi:hypothetical protein